MPNMEFLISELADRAGVTPRTIRYYTDEGLLPPPEVRGKYAYYDQEHLDRLELINRLKARHLPLREIRMIVTALSKEDVSDMLRMQDEIYEPKPPREARLMEPASEPESAREYITNLMKRTVVNNRALPSIESRQYKDPRFPDAFLAERLPHPETRWSRFEITPGVELHVEERLLGGLKEKVRKVIEFAQGVFRK